MSDEFSLIKRRRGWMRWGVRDKRVDSVVAWFFTSRGAERWLDRHIWREQRR